MVLMSYLCWQQVSISIFFDGSKTGLLRTLARLQLTRFGKE